MFKEYGALSTMLYEHKNPAGCSVGGDIEYYSSKLKSVSSLILEAGVGTGRMLIPLIQSGLNVEGVDLSPEMLAQCKINLEQHGIKADLYQQDLAKMSLPNKYGAIIMPTGSFCLLPKHIINDVLASFYNHLDEGGEFIVDLLLPSDFVSGKVESYAYDFGNKTGLLFTINSQEIDWVSQKTSYIHRYELLKNGEIKQTEISNFILYWYGISEFEMMLEAAGFADISHMFGYGDDNQKSLITFTAKK